MNNNPNYDNIEQRIIASVYLIMPKFHPVQCNECTEDEQKNLYDFMSNLYKTLYYNPTLMFKNLHEDYGFPNVFSSAGSGKEEILDLMRKELKELQNFIRLIMDIGKKGHFNGETVVYDDKMPSKYKNILSINGWEFISPQINNLNMPFFNALKWFAITCDMDIRRFETCSFDIEHDYISLVLAPLCNKDVGACEKIIEWLRNHNYQKTTILDKYEGNEDYVISYIKNTSNKPQPVGYAYMGDKFHIGFSLEYRYCAKHPCFCTIRIQKMKEILLDFDILKPEIQAFIINTNKKCDNCCYCIQTDKTKTRPKAFINVDYQEKCYKLCPYYPGFNYSFRDITDELASTIIEFIELVEKYNYN